MLNEYNKRAHLFVNKGAEAKQKWIPVLDNAIRNYKILKNILDNDKIIEKISIFLEIYGNIEPPTILPHQLAMNPMNTNTYPDWYITMPESLNLILEDIENFVADDLNSKSKIKEEYFNVITLKKGILLENGMRIEDGIIVSKEHREKLDKQLLKIIDRRIKYVLDVGYRKKLDREKKLKRILND